MKDLESTLESILESTLMGTTMKYRFQLTTLISVALLLYAPLGFSQDEEAVSSTESPVEAVNTPADQEVEINEDNYRQFMELKDERRQRNMMPETAFKPKSGVQKLDKLPEASQKHLREQLREIIVQGDPWKPGDENSEYPYTPSEAAESSQSLQKQEAEAWGELVGSYHQREAQIYGNAARSQAAAAAAGGGSGEESGGGDGSSGGSTEQGSEGQQAGQENNSKQNSAAGSYSPDSSSDSNEKSTAGVSQNAMEFLKAQGAGGSSSTPPSDSSASGNSSQQQVSQEDAQNALEFLNTQNASGSSSTPPADSSTSESTSQQQQVSQEEAQNALEFLKENSNNDTTSNSAQTPASTQNSNDEVHVTQEEAQNALEYLTSETQMPSGPNGDDDTLSIDELRNAQGIFNVTGENIQPIVDDEPPE